MEKKLNHIAKIVALVSFTIGTIILLLYLNFEENETMFINGIWYTLITTLVNIFTAIIFIILGVRHKLQSVKIARCIGILSLNIPVVIIYIYIIYATLLG